nr:FAD-binding protein [Streptomyces sparsogenes]
MAALRACAQCGVPVVPRAAIPAWSVAASPGTVRPCSARPGFADLEPVDQLSGQVTVSTGATLAAVQRRVREAGYDVAVDLAARDSVTIGGMVATNASPLLVLRWEPIRGQAVGLEAVLADGGC